MKKIFGFYSIGWLAAFGLFNVVTFVPPSSINGVSKFDTLFWISYAFISLAFIGQLACSYYILRWKNIENEYYKRMFYNISLYRVTIIGLVVMLIVGGLCMSIIQIPEWLGIIACCIVLAFNIIAIAKASIGISVVSEIDKRTKVKTLFIKMLTAEAEALMRSTSNPELSPIANKVYEAIRYSDPMSDDALTSVEDRISEQFVIVSEAIKSGNVDESSSSVDKLLRLINERNAKCKILK